MTVRRLLVANRGEIATAACPRRCLSPSWLSREVQQEQLDDNQASCHSDDVPQPIASRRRNV